MSIKSAKTEGSYIVSIGVKDKKQAFKILEAIERKVDFSFTSRIDEPPIILSNPKEEEVYYES
jgi:hypothetical protein